MALGIAALAVVGAAFYGGMAYERHQREADLAPVPGLGAADRARGEPASLELEVDEPVEVEGPDGPVVVTLDSVGLVEEYPGDRRQRYVELAVTIENRTGATTGLASLNRFFEDNLGQKQAHVLTTCTEARQLPVDPVPAGQSVKGCESMSIPDGAGRVVLEDFTPELYVEVPAA